MFRINLIMEMKHLEDSKQLQDRLGRRHQISYTHCFCKYTHASLSEC